MGDEKAEFCGLLSLAFPEHAAPDGSTLADKKADWRSLNLRSVVELEAIPPLNQSTSLPGEIAHFFNGEQSLRRAVDKLGLDRAVEMLVKEHGKTAVKDALGRVRTKKIHGGHIMLRRAVALFCKKFGVNGDLATSKAVAPFFQRRTGEHRQDSIRKLLGDARKECEKNLGWKETAQQCADMWFAECRTNSVSIALLHLHRRHWKNSPPF